MTLGKGAGRLLDGNQIAEPRGARPSFSRRINILLNQSASHLIFRSTAVGTLLLASAAQSHQADGSNSGPVTATERITSATPVSSAPPQGSAADPSEAPAADEPQADLVITGTRIRGTGPVGSVVIGLEAESIARSGASSSTELLRQVPQIFSLGADEASRDAPNQGAGANRSLSSSINLRGVSPSETLLLLNGHRLPAMGNQGDASDPSLIPTAAVQRVEVVPDGSSAIYGSDAVAGVVNFIMRRQFDGAETSARYGLADDYRFYQVSHMQGINWSSGSAVVTLEAQGHDNLSGADRDFYRQDLRPFGGADRRTNFAAPGNIIVGSTTYALPAGDGRNLTGEDLVAGTVNLIDELPLQDIVPKQDRRSASIAGQQSIGDHIVIRADAVYSKRKYHYLEAARTSSLVVPRSNPFFVSPMAGAQTVNVNYSFINDLGPTRSSGGTETYVANLNAAYELGRWTFNVGGTLGQEDVLYSQLNGIQSAALRRALADSDPLTALNPFGSGGQNNPDTLAGITAWQDNKVRHQVQQYTAEVNGPLFELPAGAVRIAAGVEYRENSLRASVFGTIQSTDTTPVLTSQSDLSRNNRAAYAEVFVPVFSGRNATAGFQRLELSGAVRYERYSDFGETVNPKLGINWSPVSGLLLRGTYGTSFRAPTLSNMDANATGGGVIASNVLDPTSPTGRSIGIHLRGGNPDLKPESATTWSVGAQYRPEFVRGLNLSVNFFHLGLRNLIGSLQTNTNLLIDEQLYSDFIIRNPSLQFIQDLIANNTVNGTINPALVKYYCDCRTQNLGRAIYEGLDFTADYDRPLDTGTITLGAAATLFTRVKTAASTVAPFRNVLGQMNYPVRFRARGFLGWQNETWRMLGYLNYVNSYTNPFVTPEERVDSLTTFDVNLAYTIPNVFGRVDGLTLELNVQNLFDSGPPFVNNSVGYGYDSQVHSAVGRTVALRAVVAW